MNLEKEVFEIAISDILPNRFQPREVFDQESIDELAQSIKEHGVIQPIIVRKIGDKYEIVAGERRFRASQAVGKTTIPALVRNIDDKESAKIALIENLQRKNLTAIEEAKTYQTILKLDNLTQEELANTLGKSQPTIANKLRLLNLDEAVQNALLNGQISERHARSLLNIDDKEKQKELLNKVILNRMTVKQLDEEITMITGQTVTTEEVPEEKVSPANIDNLFDESNIKNAPVEGKNIFNDIRNEVPPVTITNEKAPEKENSAEDAGSLIDSFANSYINVMEPTNKIEQVTPTAVTDIVTPQDNTISMSDPNLSQPVVTDAPSPVGAEPVVPQQPVYSFDQPTEPTIPAQPVVTEVPSSVGVEPVVPQQPVYSFDQPVEPTIPVQPVVTDIPSTVGVEPVVPQQPVYSFDQPTEPTIPAQPVVTDVPSSVGVETVVPQQPVYSFEQPTEPTIPAQPVVTDVPSSVGVEPVVPQQPVYSFDQPTEPTIPVQPVETDSQISVTPPIMSDKKEDIYDLRFAINNFRQAVQNTEKFGFTVETEEFDFDNIYQIIIKIDKTKQ